MWDRLRSPDDSEDRKKAQEQADRALAEAITIREELTAVAESNQRHLRANHFRERVQWAMQGTR